jgi:hypothetical protein
MRQQLVLDVLFAIATSLSTVHSGSVLSITDAYEHYYATNSSYYYNATIANNTIYYLASVSVTFDQSYTT